MTEIHEALRRWARGLYALEAGVELLIWAFDGRFASPGQPWVQQGDDPGWWWIDVEQMKEESFGALSGGETRLLRVAASLLDGPRVDLSRNLAGLDRENCQLVLGAIAHASGDQRTPRTALNEWTAVRDFEGSRPAQCGGTQWPTEAWRRHDVEQPAIGHGADRVRI